MLQILLGLLTISVGVLLLALIGALPFRLFECYWPKYNTSDFFVCFIAGLLSCLIISILLAFSFAIGNYFIGLA